MILDCFEYNQHFVAMMNVINAARLNPPAQGQKHHIIPKCWYKFHNLKVDNSPSNLVLLSIEDHKKVHKLAYRCAKETWFKDKMCYACHCMGDTLIKLNGNKNPFYGKKHSEESKLKMKEAKKGIKQSSEQVENRRKKLLGHKVSEETKKRISKANKGRKYSKDICDKLSKLRTGKSHTETWKKSYTKTIREKRDAFLEYKKLGGSLSWNKWQSLNKVTR